MPKTKAAPQAPQVTPSIIQEPEMLSIAEIRRNGGTQPRSKLYTEIVEDYKQDMLEGAVFPPVVVYHDGQDYWLADGFHRVKAAEEAGFESVQTIVKHGSRRDAVLYSVGANSQHGLRRTPQDKRRAVVMMLSDEEWCKWSNQEIARRCAVSEGFIRIIKNELTSYDTRYATNGNNSEDVKKDTYDRYGVDSSIIQEAKTRVENLPDERVYTRSGNVQTMSTTGMRTPQPGLDKALVVERPSETNLHLNTLSPIVIPEPQPIQPTPQAPEKRKRNKKIEDTLSNLKPVQTNILGKFKEIEDGQTWQLGKSHYIYCGTPTDPKFLNRLPREIALVLSFPQHGLVGNDLAEKVQAKSRLSFQTTIDDLYLGSFREAVKHFVEGTTDGGDVIVMHQIPDPALFILFEQLGCSCYCAENDPKKCNAALAAWTAIQKTARRLGSG